MPAGRNKDANLEREVRAWNGWVMLVVNVALPIAAVAFFVATVRAGAAGQLAPPDVGLRVLISIALVVVGIVKFFGHFTLQPN